MFIKEFSQGVKAYNGYLAKVHNPYKEKSLENILWDEGWDYAEKVANRV